MPMSTELRTAVTHVEHGPRQARLIDESADSSDVLWLHVSCPGFRLPVRLQPAMTEPHAWFLEHGQDISVEARLINGFYAIAGEQVRHIEYNGHVLNMF
jgi:hypothetical protein